MLGYLINDFCKLALKYKEMPLHKVMNLFLERLGEGKARDLVLTHNIMLLKAGLAARRAPVELQEAILDWHD